MSNRRNFIKSAAILGAASFIPKTNGFNLVEPTKAADIKPVDGKYALPALGYAFNALEPFIDAKTMEIHYSKHHQGYVNKLNTALEEFPQLKTMPLEVMLRDIMALPEGARNAIRNHGGGHWNHTFFWQCLKKGSAPKLKTTGMLSTTFGSVEQFKEAFEKAANGIFGSGWAWLIINKFGAMEIVTSANQDNPFNNFAEKKGRPLLGLDIWEHAYYLKHQNKRADYVSAFWNVVNWDFVESNI